MTLTNFRNEQQIIDDLRRRHRRRELAHLGGSKPSLAKPFRSLRILAHLVANA